MTRIYHTWDEWECYPAGFYEEHAPDGMSDDDCEKTYATLLSDIPEFKRIMHLVINEWRNSCEHYLTNENMNRIAWMGQAALCYKYRIPSKYRGGYHLLTLRQQLDADIAALEVINEWMFLNGYPLYDEQSIKSRTEANLY